MRLAWMSVLLASACAIPQVTFTAVGSSGGGDGSTVVDDCNVAVPVGPVSDIATVVGGGRWLSAARTPAGLVVDYTTAVGVTAVTIDLGTTPPTISGEVHLASRDATSLQLVASNDHITATMGTTAGMSIVQTDLALAITGSRVESMFSIGAPDHSAARSDGSAVIAGSTATEEQLAILGIDDQLAGFTTAPTIGGFGGSITALGSGGFAVVWLSSQTSTCHLETVDDALVSVANATIPACGAAARVAASPDGSRVASSYITNGMIEQVTLDRALTASSPVAHLTAQVSTPRLATSHDAFWTVAPASAVDLEVIPTSFTGAVMPAHRLTPFSGGGSVGFTYDVVGDGDRAWAVWLDGFVAPTLYIEQLCL